MIAIRCGDRSSSRIEYDCICRIIHRSCSLSTEFDDASSCAMSIMTLRMIASAIEPHQIATVAAAAAAAMTAADGDRSPAGEPTERSVGSRPESDCLVSRSVNGASMRHRC